MPASCDAIAALQYAHAFTDALPHLTSPNPQRELEIGSLPPRCITLGIESHQWHEGPSTACDATPSVA